MGDSGMTVNDGNGNTVNIKFSTRGFLYIIAALLSVGGAGGVGSWLGRADPGPVKASLSEGMLIMQSVEDKIDTMDTKVERVDITQSVIQADLLIVHDKLQRVENQIIDVRVEQGVIQDGFEKLGKQLNDIDNKGTHIMQEHVTNHSGQ
jgi:hypothetical protein